MRNSNYTSQNRSLLKNLKNVLVEGNLEIIDELKNHNEIHEKSYLSLIIECFKMRN